MGIKNENGDQTNNTINSKKKRHYIPGVAALQFQPQMDWDQSTAENLFQNANYSFPVNTIRYEDCITGMKTIPTESIDLIVADCPFGLEFSGKEAFYNRKSNLVVENYGEITEDYQKFTHDWIAELPRIMKKTAAGFLFSGWTNLNSLLSAIEANGLHLINHIIWMYQFGVFTKRKFVTSHYHVLFVAKDPKEYFFNKIEHYPLDVWQIPRNYQPGQEKNGTKLPEEVVMRCIDFGSKPGDLVFDPFMGNGTTAIVAKGTYRHYLGFEINQCMQPVIEHNLKQIRLGQFYTPYKTRLPSREELESKYPQAKKKLTKSKP